MRSPRTTRVAALAGALVVVGLAGCSAGAPAVVGPTNSTVGVTGASTPPSAPTSTTPVPTSAPTWPPVVALPTPPPEMARDDEAGAVAAAKYFLDLYAYTESTQDTGPWEAMSHPDCVFCKSVMDDVTARLAAGQVVRPATMFVHSVAPTVLNPLAYSVAIDVSTGPDEVRWTDGSLVSAGKRERGVMTTAVVWQAARWIVRDVSLELER